MITRILPRAEYPRLAGTELEAVWPVLPMGAHVVVVEDGAELVGCWALFPVYHVEGVWIAPGKRARASVARRLVVGMMTAAKALGARAVNTAARDQPVAEMLERLGAVEVPGRHYSLRVGD